MILSKIQQFSRDDVKVLAKEPLFKGFFSLFKYRFQHRLHEGGWSKDIEREVFIRGHAVAVLPYDPATGEFILIEQFRVGAIEDSEQPWLLEVVAGIIEEGESEEEVCRREAKEEAGIEVTELFPVMEYFPSPGGCTETLSLYFAFADASNAGGVHGLDEEGEDILVHRVAEDTAMQWLKEGRFINSATIIALQWFALNKEQILADYNKK